MDNNFLNRLFGLKGKVVLITGATGQLGQAICKAYLRAGARVIGTDLALNKQKMLKSKKIEYFTMDISDSHSVVKAFSNFYSAYGRIDILVNNAGVSCFEPFLERPEQSFDWVMDTNLKGTFLCLQNYVKQAKKKKQKANIINIGSIYGLISPDYRIYTDCKRVSSEVYGATKAGIIQMTRYFAAHLAPYGIRVNCVSPGGIYNPEHPQGKDFLKNYSYRCPLARMARAEEIAAGVLYLSSGAASYVTGHNLVIDGGMSSW